jgi:hypothetical protein
MLSLLTTLATSIALADNVNFDDLKTGAPPPGWTATKTGTGDPKWEIVADNSAPTKPNVLKQSGVATYPVCIKDDTNLKDGFVEVKFKPVSGSEDQAGGVIWRCKDADNYYIARANALENNVTIYHTVNGKRVEKKRINTKVASNHWHSFRVDFKDNYFVVTFDGRKAFGWKDDTFKDAGKVGVWTKADSTTLFDDFTYGPESKVTKADIADINKGTKAPGQTAAEGDDDDDKKIITSAAKPLSTAPGTRTSLLIPDLKLLCLAVPHRGSQSAEIRIFKAP